MTTENQYLKIRVKNDKAHIPNEWAESDMLGDLLEGVDKLDPEYERLANLIPKDDDGYRSKGTIRNHHRAGGTEAMLIEMGMTSKQVRFYGPTSVVQIPKKVLNDETLGAIVVKAMKAKANMSTIIAECGYGPNWSKLKEESDGDDGDGDGEGEGEDAGPASVTTHAEIVVRSLTAMLAQAETADLAELVQALDMVNGALTPVVDTVNARKAAELVNA